MACLHYQQGGSIMLAHIKETQIGSQRLAVKCKAIYGQSTCVGRSKITLYPWIDISILQAFPYDKYPEL